MNKKNILAIVCVIAIVGLAFGYFKLSKEEQPAQGQDVINVHANVKQQEEAPELAIEDIEDISNWQTYTNEEYGFEMKYPEEWYVSEDTEDSGPEFGEIKTIYFSNLEPTNTTKEPLTYLISIISNQDEVIFNSNKDSVLAFIGASDSMINLDSSVIEDLYFMINSNPDYPSQESALPYSRTAIEDNSYMYVFSNNDSTLLEQEEKLELISIFKKSLETFKFTD